MASRRSNEHVKVCCLMQILVNGKEVMRTTQLYYFAMNKPKGYLCANVPNKEGTSKLVIDLFQVLFCTVKRQQLYEKLCPAHSFFGLPMHEICACACLTGVVRDRLEAEELICSGSPSSLVHSGAS